MVWGRMGDSLGWFPAACVGLGPVATYSKDANRLPPELSLETKTLAQIRRDFARKKVNISQFFDIIKIAIHISQDIIFTICNHWLTF